MIIESYAESIIREPKKLLQFAIWDDIHLLSSPMIAEGILYIGSGDKYLYALGKPKK